MKRMLELDLLKFSEDGLIPACVTDVQTGELVMVAYMNRQSLQKTLQEGTTCFYSRSRKELWRKGQTSGNVQHVVSIKADCDYDCLLITARLDGPACHTGNKSCFFNELYTSDEYSERFTLDALAGLIADRRKNPKEGSYTNYLFDKGLDKILKKIGEESTEVIIAAKDEDKAETVYEIADLAYHILVLMEQNGITISQIKDELASRHVIDKKVKQEKMT